MAGAAGPDHVPGRLLAVPARGVETQQKLAALMARGARLARQMPTLNIDLLEVPEDSSEIILQSLRQSGIYAAVERDSYAHIAGDTVPNDPSYSRQWHLPRIAAPAAWSVTTGATAIVIAVIDTGVDGHHADLSSKLATGWNFLSGTTDTTDTLGHGTAVAGTAAAASDNAIGVAGVNWNSRIMPLAVVDENEFAAYSDIASAIQYASDHGARIVNISIGGSSPSSVLQTAVDYAWSKNVVIFASAMNDSSPQPNYPAACNHVVAVSATDSNDMLADFSNYGPWISLAAPGSNILTTSMGGGYGYWSGTSFSAPVASGVAALALAVDPSLSAPALVSLLEQSADNSAGGFNETFGWGRVNAYKAVSAALTAALRITPASQTVTLHSAQTQQFTAIVASATAPTVSWAVSPAIGSISAGGLYTAPSSISSDQTITVTASVGGVIAASSTVTLLPDPSNRSPLLNSPHQPPSPRRIRK